MAKYIIDETTLVGFGDQARRLGNVEGELSPAQMQEIFAGVTAGGSGESNIGLSVETMASACILEIQKATVESLLNMTNLKVETNAVGILTE